MYSLIKKLMFLIVFFNHINCIVIGSFIAPTRQNAATFPSTDANNEMRGYAAFENGFTFGNNTTRCLFNSYFPIGGTIVMNGGLLNLNVDLTLSSGASFMSTGSINGNGLSLSFPFQEGIFSIPASTGSVGVGSGFLTLIDTEPAPSALPVNSVDTSPDNLYIADVTDSGSANLAIFSFNGTTLTLAASTATTKDNSSVSWHPVLDWFAVGADNLRTFSWVRGTNTISAGNTATISNPVKSVAWRPNPGATSSFVAGGGATSSPRLSVFSFNNSTSVMSAVTGSPILLATGQIPQNNAISWTSDGQFIALGTAAASAGATRELNIFAFNGTTLSSKTQFNVGNTVTAVAWSSSGTYFLAVGLSGGTENIRIFQYDSGLDTLTDLAASHVGETANVLGTAWSPDGSTVVFCLATNSGTELRTYNFNQSTGVLTLTASASSASNVNNVRWSDNGSYITTGDAANNVNVYGISLGTSNSFILQNIKTFFNSDISITTTTLLLGNCQIEGNNYTLDLAQTNSFTIGSGANVLLKNMSIQGISGTKINFADTTGVLKLRNVTWIQSGDYTFSNGALTIDGNCLFTGTSNFIYSSGKTSTINSGATLMFDSGMTFSYAPTIANQNLLEMIDNLSNLYLLNTSLVSTLTGLQLTKGNLIVEGICPIRNSATVTAQAMALGDGLSAANNVGINILAESGFNITNGMLVYQNV